MESLNPQSPERNLLPSRVVDLALMRPLDELQKAVPSGFVVLVRVGLDDGALAAELSNIYGAGLDGDSAPRVLEFHTVVAQTDDMPTIPPEHGQRGQEIAAVRRFIGAETCFAAPLVKREAGSMGDSITVGRAMNKDLVLRAAGVSKLHAWFEIEGDEIRLCDAGSKNGTFIAGVRIPAREPRALEMGTTIAFSSIEATVCTTEMLWQLLRDPRVQL